MDKYLEEDDVHDRHAGSSFWRERIVVGGGMTTS